MSGMHVTSPCRALVEGRDAACIERDRAVQGEKDAVRKYEELLSRWGHAHIHTNIPT